MKESVNKTELRMIVKEYEETDIRRSTKVSELISIAEGETELDDEHKCPLSPIKETMEDYIQANIRSMRTQLPECTGHCTTFGCPDGVVVNCFIQLKPILNKEN